MSLFLMAFFFYLLLCNLILLIKFFIFLSKKFDFVRIYICGGEFMDDHQIIEMIKRDANSGIAVLLDKYGGLLSYICNNTGINKKEDQEECISDIMYIVWKKIRKFDSCKASFKTWLVLLARGCSVDFVRKNKYMANVIAYEDLEDIMLIKNEETILRMNEVFQQLTPPDNYIFYKKFVIGESVKDIAEQLKMSVDNIYKRISRGKQNIKEILCKERGL